MRILLLAALFVTATLVVIAQETPGSRGGYLGKTRVTEAIAYIGFLPGIGTGIGNVTGTVTFFQANDSADTTIIIFLDGLTPGKNIQVGLDGLLDACHI